MTTDIKKNPKIRQDIDVSENSLLMSDPDILATLLKDRTTGRNIFWSTDSYKELGDGYQSGDEITKEKITGENGKVIQPRAVKCRAEQTRRSKDMAEVFTPSWVCNSQNNLIDEAWFGRKDVFNKELTTEAGIQTWTLTDTPITFPEGKTWQDYVLDVRLEITCGEAPYIASRYDTVTGEPILPVGRRIGILDRKLRVVGENVATSEDWLFWTRQALKSTYGFEWQGDNLLLARESVLMTVCDWYKDRFRRKISSRSLPAMAEIISWNLWQMDGLKGVVPGSCHTDNIEVGLFGETEQCPCVGCKSGDIRRHNGTYCRVRDWSTDSVIDFISLIKQ